MKRVALLIVSLFLGGVSHAAFPVIFISSTAGSDTAASGAGPATAITATGAAYTQTASSDTVWFTGSPDLSGVATDGSALLWVSTPIASVRQFSKIVGVDNTAKNVKVQDTYTLTVASADYAIGGKRKTLSTASSIRLGLDVYDGWGLSISSEGVTLSASPYTITQTVDAAAPPFFIRSTDDVNRATCTTTVANGKIFSFGAAARVRVTSLNLQCSNATKTTSSAFQGNAAVVLVASGCYFTNLGNGGNRSSGNPDETFLRSTFIGMQGSFYTGAGTGRLVESSLLDSTVSAASGITNLYVINSIIARATGDCIIAAGNTLQILTGSTLHGCTGDGLDTTSATGNYVYVVGNNFTGNGGIGWNADSTDDNAASYHDFNNFGSGATANTGGAVSGITLAANELQVDPGYANATNSDFRVGANVYGKWFSNPIMGSNTTTFRDIGASQHQDVGGRVAVGY